MKRILFFFGGCSSEYTVSLASAQGILSHLDRAAYTSLPVGITRCTNPEAFTGGSTGTTT